MKLGIWQALLLCVNLGAGCASLSSAQPPSMQTLPAQAAGYRLVFLDDFHPLDLSPDGTGDHRWYNGVWFRNQLPPNSNIDTSPGYLSLHWKRGQASPETSITTLSRDAHHFRAWRYGYFEARMKWNPVAGSWPAFWLIPVQDANRTDQYQGKPDAGEIDIFEGQGDRPAEFYATIHEWVGYKDLHNNNANNRFPLPRHADYAQWHNYGLLWTPGTITWFFDRVPIHTESTYPVFDKQDYYLALTEQVGVAWTYGNLSGVTANDMSLDVQWVKVWQP